jgi:hypothetical protein
MKEMNNIEYRDVYGKNTIRLIVKYYCLFICGVDFSGSVLRVIYRFGEHGEDFRV